MSSVTPTPTTLVIMLSRASGFFSSFNCVVNHLHHSLGRNGVTAIRVDWRAFEGRTAFPYGTTADGSLWERFFMPLEFPAYPEHVVRTDRYADERMTNVNAYLHIYKRPARRRAYHRAFARHIRLAPRLRSAIERFHQDRMRGHYCVGVHFRNVRHSIECLEQIPPIEEFIRRTRRLIHGRADARVFLATDVEEAVERFRDAFGGRLVYQPGVTRALRDGDEHGHHGPETASAQLGDQVVLDCFLLARCDVLLHVTSNVATAAACINPKLRLVYCERGAVRGLYRYAVRQALMVALAPGRPAPPWWRLLQRVRVLESTGLVPPDARQRLVRRLAPATRRDS